MFVHIIPSSVWAAEWPPFGKELLTGLSINMFPLFFFNFSPVSVLFLQQFPHSYYPKLGPNYFWSELSHTMYIHLQQLSF